MLPVALAAALTACPFAADAYTPIALKRDLPAGTADLIGPMAEKGAPFQVSDVLPPGGHPPFLRFMSAMGKGCDVLITYEYGGIGHGVTTAQLHYDGRAWRRVAKGDGAS